MIGNHSGCWHGKTGMPRAGNDMKIGDQALGWGWEGKTGRIADYRHLSL